MGKVPTLFQKLNKTLGGSIDNTIGQNSGSNYKPSSNNIYNFSSIGDKKGNPIFSTKNKNEYDKKMLELKQQHYLSNQWHRSNRDLANKQFAGLSQVQIMYRDVELMDAFPEIGAALDIYADESCVTNNDGQIINVISKSSRIKSIVEDLLTNRLALQLTAPMVIRAMCKYGNEYMLLNIDKENGVLGWKQMPVMEIERHEAGLNNPYSSYGTNSKKNNSDDVEFSWLSNGNEIYKNWQMGHFRLITDGQFLPYGCSILHKARRHFRMLSMMEDMMLIYRLDKSIERRVYKIYVGAIDDKDVPAYVEEIANEFKRTPIVDPQTGQLDLRKNLMSVDSDIFIPVREANASNPIDTLSAGQNLTSIDDIKYIQGKVLCALRIPKSFLNFDETVGAGQNLSLLDVRFSRVINRIQQAFLMELSKIVTIHLYILGFKDDLTNFTLTMNNPSTQAEQLEIDNFTKKISTFRDAVTDPGTGVPIMSMSKAWRSILKWSDDDISTNLQELRLEKALSEELKKTSQIIKRTHMFDATDNTYGESGAEYMDNAQGADGTDDGLGGGDMGAGMSGGLDDLGGVGDETAEGELNGEEANVKPNEANNDNVDGAQAELPEDNAGANEDYENNKPLLNENIYDELIDIIGDKEKNNIKKKPIKEELELFNPKFDELIKDIDNFLEK